MENTEPMEPTGPAEANEPAGSAAPAPKKGLTKNGVILMVFALFVFVCAYIFTCTVPISGMPFGFLALAAALFGGTLAVGLILGAKPDLFTFAAMLVGLAAAFSRVLNASFHFDLTPVFCITAVSYLFFALSLFSNHSRGLGGSFLLDIAKSFAYAFISFGEFFRAVFRPEGSRRNGRGVLYAVLGLLFALILVFAVAGLLSYDAHFADMLPKLDLDTVGEVLVKLFFAVPLAALAFSCFFSSLGRKLPALSDKQNTERIGSKLHVIPVLPVALPVAAVLAVYVMFFVSQWAYYVSAFTHVLPAGYSAAEYAREGFFSLLVVTVINAVLLTVLTVFAKKESRAGNTVVSILKLALCAATLVLIATALSKMFLYIDRFDLTRDRLIATLVLVFLAVCFIAVILSTLIRRVKALPIMTAAAALMLLAFFFAAPNRLIASSAYSEQVG